VFRLVLEAQKQGEPVALITSRKSTFFPPDVADAGIDVTAVAVIRGPDNIAAARAA
jgi:recombination protein RecA